MKPTSVMPIDPMHVALLQERQGPPGARACGPGSLGTADTTAPVTVTVSNAASGSSVVITSPPSGAWTGNRIGVNAAASGAPVATMKFYGDGVQFGETARSRRGLPRSPSWLPVRAAPERPRTR